MEEIYARPRDPNAEPTSTPTLGPRQSAWATATEAALEGYPLTTPTRVPTNTPTPRPDPTATPDPTPTRTPRVPTATPDPTPTRVPTQTPVPTSTRTPRPSTPTPGPRATGPGSRGGVIVPRRQAPPGFPPSAWGRVMAAAYTPEVDAILDKLDREGRDALTPDEKASLQEAAGIIDIYVGRHERGEPIFDDEPAPDATPGATTEPPVDATAPTTGVFDLGPPSASFGGLGPNGEADSDILTVTDPYDNQMEMTRAQYNQQGPGYYTVVNSRPAEPLGAQGASGPSGDDLAEMYPRSDEPLEGASPTPSDAPRPPIQPPAGVTAPVAPPARPSAPAPSPPRPPDLGPPPIRAMNPDPEPNSSDPLSAAAQGRRVAARPTPPVPTAPKPPTAPPTPPAPAPRPPEPPKPPPVWDTGGRAIRQGPLRQSIEQAGGTATDRSAGRVANEIGDVVQKGWQGNTGGWRTLAQQAASAWEQQYRDDPNSLRPAERQAYEADPASLHARILDADSPFRDYRESWIGAVRKGEIVPTAQAFDKDVRDYGGTGYRSPFAGAPATATSPGNGTGSATSGVAPATGGDWYDNLWGGSGAPRPAPEPAPVEGATPPTEAPSVDVPDVGPPGTDQTMYRKMVGDPNQPAPDDGYTDPDLQTLPFNPNASGMQRGNPRDGYYDRDGLWHWNDDAPAPNTDYPQDGGADQMFRQPLSDDGTDPRPGRINERDPMANEMTDLVPMTDTPGYAYGYGDADYQEPPPLSDEEAAQEADAERAYTSGGLDDLYPQDQQPYEEDQPVDEGDGQDNPSAYYYDDQEAVA